VAALFLGWIILGEQLESELQWVGAIIVVITITWFLSSQIRVREDLEPELSS
jgi:drug/metabolite transporter (DMT)-like permease